MGNEHSGNFASRRPRKLVVTALSYLPAELIGAAMATSLAMYRYMTRLLWAAGMKRTWRGR